MKKLYFPLSFICLLTASTVFGQQRESFTKAFEPVRSDLVSWDKVRGEWLAESMQAMVNKQPIPDRNFPENYTPAEMFEAMPAEKQQAIRRHIKAESETNTDSLSRRQFAQLNNFASRPNCKPVTGRTHGDPHLTSFDGTSFDFQTVGEFTLVRNTLGDFNIQVRQRSQSDDFSLNTAVAMEVAGDRVAFYANERPDGNSSTPVRVNGQAVYVETGNFFLNNGGTISKSKNDYIVTWPTGERLKIAMHDNAQMGFMNLAVEIFPCNSSYEGILGNANGNPRDDFNPRNGSMDTRWNPSVFSSSDARSQEMQKEYLAYIAKDFARSWRITQEESLFDYGFGQSTLAFTDESYPRVHHTIGDLSQNQRDRSRKECERRGFAGQDLQACIYDNGFINMQPTPPPTVPGRVYKPMPPVVTPSPNVNPGGRVVRELKPIKNPAVAPNGGNPRGIESIDNKKEPVVTPNNGGEAQPIRTSPNTKNTTIKDPVTPKTSEPIVKPTPNEPYYPEPVEPKKPRTTIFRTIEPSNPSNGGSGNSTPSAPTPAPRTPTPMPRSVPAPAPKPAPTPAVKPTPALKTPTPMRKP